jgi:hypothetical protein
MKQQAKHHNICDFHKLSKDKLIEEKGNAACTECRAIATPLPRRYFLERIIVFSKFLHITYTKTTT